MNLTIHGDCPTKKNSRTFIRSGRQTISLPGHYYREWHAQALKQLYGVARYRGERVSEVELLFYPRTKRRADLSNKAESVMDLLVDAGVIPDDNWYEVPRLVLAFGAVDKANPRVEVAIR